jgi:hypothetical protein
MVAIIQTEGENKQSSSAQFFRKREVNAGAGLLWNIRPSSWAFLLLESQTFPCRFRPPH